VWHPRPRLCSDGVLLFSASQRLRSEALAFRCRAITARSARHPYPSLVIPDWRRFERDHPNPSQIGVDFSDQASFGVDLVGSGFKLPDYQITHLLNSAVRTWQVDPGSDFRVFKELRATSHPWVLPYYSCFIRPNQLRIRTCP
jgi:hypothetical protein